MFRIPAHAARHARQALLDPAGGVDGNIRAELLGSLQTPPLGAATHYVCHAWGGR
jgi:hypothetical protein